MEQDIVRARQNKLVALSSRVPFAEVFQMTLSFDNTGNAICRMPYSPKFNHAAGGTHGGIYGLLLDTVGWCVLTPHYSELLTTVEYETKLLDQVVEKELIACGQVVRLGKNVAVASMSVKSSDDSLIAIGSGSYVVTQKEFWR